MVVRRLTRLAIAATALVAVRAMAAQPREAHVGIYSTVSSGTLPFFSVGAGAIVDLVSAKRYAYRAAVSVTAPVAYMSEKVCLLSPGGACSEGGTPNGAQLLTVLGDVAARFGDDGHARVFASLGGYVVNPGLHQFGGGWLIERHADVVAGIGYERLFGGADPHYSFTLRYLRYSWVYQQNPYAGTIGISRVFRFD